MEQQIAQWLEAQPPEMLLAFLQIILNSTPEQLQQLIQQLQEAVGGGQQAQGQPQGNSVSERDMGSQNLYGDQAAADAGMWG